MNGYIEVFVNGASQISVGHNITGYGYFGIAGHQNTYNDKILCTDYNVTPSGIVTYNSIPVTHTDQDNNLLNTLTMNDLKKILEKNYFSTRLNTTTNLRTSLSRQEIEDVLTENNISLPLQNSVEFFIVDSRDHRFRVLYSKDFDEYSYLKYKHTN
jgi:hypothetical protein